MTPHEIADELERLAGVIRQREDDLREAGELGMDRRGLATDIAEYRANVVVEMYANLPAIIAALRQPRGDDETVERVADRLTKTPCIEALTPTNREWLDCYTVQDAYDLMKRKVRAAIGAMR